ncbi:MAG: hypothetical protein JO097_01115 [Acidobacteriaceae bacterium]|nr:hypothetical protein [Acidobacteriaceae bacterium]
MQCTDCSNIPRLLEVIVTSLQEAREAELGGADRLELVRSLGCGGLTPSPELVQEIVASVSIPVRVMVRENASMSVSGPPEMRILRSYVETFAKLPVDGLVFGFIKGGALDLKTIRALLAAAPHLPVTFHRAFEHVEHPLATIEQLKEFPQIDRILTSGGSGSWRERKARLIEWQRAAAPQIKILVGTGLRTSIFADLRDESGLSELHVGRAARVPRAVSGVVDRAQVAALKSALL